LLGNYFFGMAACLVISKSMKIFLTTPRPYFLDACQLNPNITVCKGLTQKDCLTTNYTILDDARSASNTALLLLAVTSPPSSTDLHPLVLFRISMPGQLSGVCRCPAGALASHRSGAEISLLGLRLSVSAGASLGDFLLAPACPVEEKITL